ncbi:MAG: cobalamin-dependent protein [Candidatus Latescibacterota bacterium]|nr:MAG: cobalamin-dependent protein [Candidatus Latescibacterota bacterium]
MSRTLAIQRTGLPLGAAAPSLLSSGPRARRKRGRGVVDMTAFKEFAATLLENGAASYGAYAANALLERHSATSDRFTPESFADWKAHLSMRVLELSIAVETHSPELFATAVDWTRQSFQARHVPQEDLEASLVCLRETLLAELPENATEAIEPCFEQALQRFKQPVPPVERLDPNHPRSHLVLTYLEACLTGDRHRAIRTVLDAVDSGLDVQDAYLDVLVPAQREVGEMWHAAKMGIHEEHVVTATTQSVMALLAERGSRNKPNGKSVLLASVASNAHDLGPRVLTDLFEIAGWRAIGLGPSLPAEDLAQAVSHFQVDLVALSATLITQLKNLRHAVETIRAHNADVKILVGGLALAAAPGIWEWVGADAHASGIGDIMKSANRLVGLGD